MILDLSDKYSVLSLCHEMNINRSGFYKWLNRRSHPSQRTILRNTASQLFEEYHKRFPSHGYRWLNAKIRLVLGVVFSDNYAHKICKFLNIKSRSKHFKRYGKKVNRELKNFPNFILAELTPFAPFMVVVSDMTAFWTNKHYYELTLFMDLFNNEIIAFCLSDKKGDPNTYHLALLTVLQKKKNIATLSLSFILTKVLSILLRNLMNLFLFIILFIRCQSLLLLLKMAPWKLSMAGLKKNYLLILILILLMMSFLKLSDIFIISIMKDLNLL